MKNRSEPFDVRHANTADVEQIARLTIMDIGYAVTVEETASRLSAFL